MKLFVVLMTVFCMQLSANVWSQSVVNANFKQASLKEVIKEFKKQTGVFFMYDEDIMCSEVKVDSKINNLGLQKALDKVFESLPYQYKKIENYVLITKKKIESKSEDKKITIKGVVKDKKGTPLVGVTVMIKGTTTGVSTNTKGEFSLLVEKESKPVLIFSFIGMISKELKYKGQKDIKIVLEEDTAELGEVVVTGYQRIEKRKLSSSVISVKGDDIKEGSAISVDKMLQGKLAGVTVIGQSSTPGAAPKIRIRGASSISGNREPVWVVDGVILEDPVQVSTEELNSLDKVNFIGNAISWLNPEDIDRIDVLKDASATAIYGVKAANGVIVVTTKKGKYGPARVKYSNNFSVTMAPTYDDMYRMNSKDRIEVSQEMEERSLTFSSMKPGSVAYEGALMQLWAKEISYDQFRQKVKELKETNTDWYDLLFRNALSQNHNITVSGADDKTNYYFSGGFSDNQGATTGVGLKRFNTLMKINSRLTERLKVGFQLNAAVSKNKRPHSSVDLYQYAYETSRAIKAYNADGSYSYYNDANGYLEPLKYNVFNELDNSEQTIENKSIGFNFTVNWNIAEGINYSGLVSYTNNSNYQTEWANDKSFYIAKLRQTNYGAPLDDTNESFVEDQCELPYGGELSNKDTRNSSFTVRNSVSFIKHIQKHELAASIGTEVRSIEYKGLSSIQRGYLPERGMKSATINPLKWQAYAEWLKNNHDQITDNTTNTLSFYSTFTYSYDNRYSLNFNIRTDGSNKFGQDKSVRFLPVWSVSGRWNIQEESMFKNVSWLNLLAARASYGVQGNVHPDQTPNLITKMGSLNDMIGEFESTLYKLPNDKLKWEKTTSYDFGLEFAFLDNRIFGTFDVYKKVGKDQVISKEVSVTTGAGSVSINGGNIENKGWEMSLNVTPIKAKDFTWSLSANTSKNINTVTKAGDDNYSYTDYLTGSIIRKGKPINGFYSYKFDKLDENGLPTFKDIEETEGISKDEMFEKVFTYSGKRVPDLSGGFSSTFRYKQLTVNCLFSYSLGSHVRLNNLYDSDGQKLPGPQQNMSSDFVNRWKKKGDEEFTNIPSLSSDDLMLRYRNIDIANNKWEMYNMSDLRVVSGDFLRLRNIGLRYSFNSDFCKKLHVNSLNLHCEAGNLFYWADKELKGRDPEQITLGSGSIPPAKTFTFGFDVTF